MERKTLFMAALVATLGATGATAGPLIFEETAKITSPDPAYTAFPLKVAVEGDSIIATGLKVAFTTVPYEHYRSYYAAFLFRRQGSGTWTFERILAENSCDEGEQGEDTCPVSVAIRNGVAAVSAGQVYVFRRAANGAWVAESSNAFSGPGDVAVGNGAIVTSYPVCEGLGLNGFRPNASGVWTKTFSVDSDIACDLWGTTGKPVDLSPGNRFLALDFGASPADAAYIFEPTSTSWTQPAAFSTPIFGGAGIDDTRAFVAGPPEETIRVFNSAGGTWVNSVDIVPSDSAMRLAPARIKARDRVVASFSSDPDRGGSVGIFRANSSGQYDEVAKLVTSSLPSSYPWLGSGSAMDAYVNGSLTRVVATGPGGVHVFDVNQLGMAPPPLQDDFEQGNASSWTPLAGSNFSVVSAGGSKVYRQSNTTGDAGAYAANTNWTNQAIEADVRPTAFDGADRWVGLVVRRTDASNYYYLTLRQSTCSS